MVDVNHFVFFLQFHKGGLSEPPKKGNMFPPQKAWGFLNLNFSNPVHLFSRNFVGSANARNLNFGVVKDPTVARNHVLPVPVL